jgi:hypothetical protein
MPTTTIRVLGTHRVERTPALERRALDRKYGSLKLHGSELQKAVAHVQEEIDGAVLIELLVEQRDARFDLGAFGQRGSEQAPYDERYLTEDGAAVVSEGYEVPTTSTLRVAFFLHYIDPKLPLDTPYGPVPLPLPTEMPSRLAAIVPYEPVD